MAIKSPPLLPELDVSDLERSLAVYLDVFGFKAHVRRPEEKFAYLVRGDVHLMLEEAAGPGRRLRTAPLEHPYGRGMNLMIEVADLDALHAKVVAAGLSLLIPLEERWYRHDAEEVGVRQFTVIDPDGYLLRFCTSLGTRPARALP